MMDLTFECETKDSATCEILPSSWLSHAARLPVAFAQVREDAAIDRWVVEQLAPGAKVLMIASGGCSAAVLATVPQVSQLHLIDRNPAQIALARLKLRLLSTTDPAERLAILGHIPMSAFKRETILLRHLQALHLLPNTVGPLNFVAEVGLDHAGRYELLFSELRAELNEYADEFTALLELRDPIEQSQRAHPATPLGQALDAAFDSVIALPNLIALFGEAATRNRHEPFATHFARRTRHVLSTLPAADNPYLWQLLKGRFADSQTFYPWLVTEARAPTANISWSISTMTEALRNCDQAFDFIHLSNILDWLSPDKACATLELTWQALRPGGFTLIRQLNSTLDIESLGERFHWQRASARKLHDRDRSFFYRKLHLGRKS